MKIITKEEEEAHWRVVVKGGLVGGTIGLGLGLGGAALAARRFPGFRKLTIQFRAFLVSSATTAGAVIVAERRSIAFQRARDPAAGYRDETQRALDDALRQNRAQAALEWGRENRYTIVCAAWAASMLAAFAVVSRNRYLTGAQKLVQARMYAQFLTLGILIVTALLETADATGQKGRWETVKVIDPDDPEHKHIIEKRIHKEEYEGQDLWKDMVAAEERRLEQRKNKEAEAKAVAANSHKKAS